MHPVQEPHVRHVALEREPRLEPEPAQHGLEHLVHRGGGIVGCVVVVEGGLDAVHGGDVPLLGERDDPGDVGVGEEPRVLQVGGEALVHEHRPLDVAQRPEPAAGPRGDEPLLVAGEGGEVGVHQPHPPRPRRRRLDRDPGARDHAELAQTAEDGVEQVSVELLGARHRLPVACTNCTQSQRPTIKATYFK